MPKVMVVNTFIGSRPIERSRVKLKSTCTSLINTCMMVDEATKKTLASIPLLRTNAGPRDGDQWASRLKEEYLSLIKVILNVVTR